MRRRSVLIPALLLALPAAADEGMWTFDNVPKAAVRQKYGVELTDSWLQRLQRSIIRQESGCTGSFVSADGLMLTNHHCSMGCLADLSSASANYVADGFRADTRGQERKCPGKIVSVLVDMEDVTDKVQAATAGLADAAANEARKRALSSLESDCAEKQKSTASKRSAGALACESVSLYQGGQYWLYKYKRYDDVRLTFAPEQAIGAFGGDPDNFNFPRWSLDFSLLRVYENGRPAHTPDYLRWRAEGPNVGEPVFVVGHPGTTNRLLTVEQLKSLREVLSSSLLRTSELRGRLIQWSKTGEEPQRIVRSILQSLENSLKIQRGRQLALLDDAALARKAEQERELRKLIAADPRLSARVGESWENIARALERNRLVRERHLYLEGGAGFGGTLFSYAKTLVRSATERSKPNEHRLREYADSALPKLRQRLLAVTPVYSEYERITLSFSLDKMREALGPDDTIVRKVFGDESPESLAEKLIEGTQLADPAVRSALWEGGAAAIENSSDPMIALARSIDDEARSLRKIVDDEVQAPIARAQERIAEARFAVFGRNAYPDATFTLRLSYGAVKGWIERGEQVAPFTRLAGLYDRATGMDPYRIPQPWLESRNTLEMDTVFNYATTNDIVGGNSGSPVVDSKGQLVGLAFDGNIHSIAGNYWYDGEVNRAVAVHPAIMLSALRDVYRRDALVREILGTPPARRSRQSHGNGARGGKFIAE